MQKSAIQNVNVRESHSDEIAIRGVRNKKLAKLRKLGILQGEYELRISNLETTFMAGTGYPNQIRRFLNIFES